MQRVYSLMDYPIFRLTVSMAAGIFLFDRLTMEQVDTVVVWEILIGVWMLLVVGLIILYRSNSYRGRTRFGVLTTLSLIVFGAFRVMQERQEVDFQWSTEEEVYYGKVLTPPVRKGKTWQSEVAVKYCYLLNQSAGDSLPLYQVLPVRRTVLLYVMPDSVQGTLSCGDWLLFHARVGRPASEEELTGFNYGGYLYRKGISGTAMAFSGRWQKLRKTSERNVKELALMARQKVVQCYREWGMEKNELAVVAALTIGDKSILTADMKEMYSAAGVSHVLALSGLHIGILSALLFGLLYPLKYLPYGEMFRSLCVVLALWVFAFLSGLSPSVVRAVTMCTLYFGASCMLEERFFSVYALLLTAFIMLIYQPFYLFDLSFQLSFLAVASILYFYPLVNNIFTPKLKVLRWIWNGMAVSISAQLGTLPLILYYFGTFPVYFLLANQVVSILAVCIVGGTLASLALSVVPWLGDLSVKFLSYSTWTLNASVRWIQQLEGSQLTAISISAFQAVCGFIFLYGLYSFWNHRTARNCMFVLLSLSFTFGAWVYRSSTVPSTHLYLSRSSLYLKQGEKVQLVSSASGLYQIDTLRIGILKDTTWTHKQAQPKIPLDYVYLCRGFRGNLATLRRVFTIRHLILDVSLSTRYRRLLEQQCNEQKIPFTSLLSTDTIQFYRIKL